MNFAVIFPVLERCAGVDFLECGSPSNPVIEGEEADDAEVEEENPPCTDLA